MEAFFKAAVPNFLKNMSLSFGSALRGGSCCSWSGGVARHVQVRERGVDCKRGRDPLRAYGATRFPKNDSIVENSPTSSIFERQLPKSLLKERSPRYDREMEGTR